MKALWMFLFFVLCIEVIDEAVNVFVDLGHGLGKLLVYAVIVVVKALVTVDTGLVAPFAVDTVLVNNLG